jgi:hypothetical protein
MALPTLFLMRLLSLIDAILKIPMPEVLDHGPLDYETKAVLSGPPAGCDRSIN